MLGNELDFCNYRRFFRDRRSWKDARGRIIDTRFLAAMAEDATGIPTAGMPMDKGRNAGNREHGNDSNQEILAPVFAHSVH